MGNSYDKLEKRLEEHQTAAEEQISRIELLMAERELIRAKEKDQIEDAVNKQRDDINSIAGGLKDMNEILTNGDKHRDMANKLMMSFLARINNTNVFLGKALRYLS